MDNKLQPCILPWVNFCTNPFGRSRPCGYSENKSKVKVQDSSISAEFNNEVFTSIRKDFLNGKWPENCKRCEYTEKNQPGHSKKSAEDFYFNQHAHLIENTSPDGKVAHFPRHIDIRLGTVCNLKCIHCGTGNSNKWLEDKSLLGKYQNTENIRQDNTWVDNENALWRDVYEHLDEIEKFNFQGGEPFASQQHKRLIAKIVEAGRAPFVILHYVTNGTLFTTSLLEQLNLFKQVTINVSFDVVDEPLSFYRFPINVSVLKANLDLLKKYSSSNIEIALQWTSSNISLFYLPETLHYFEKNLELFKFKFCNYVEQPRQLSPQNLPQSVKENIKARLQPWLNKYPEINFYLNHMEAQDLWDNGKDELFSYLNDLSSERKINWNSSLNDFSKAIN